eukprot:SAG31_NODE_380_length_16468_cov_8.328548_4_plen_121_part_00
MSATCSTGAAVASKFGQRQQDQPPPAGFVPYRELRRRPRVGTAIALFYDGGLGWATGVVTTVESVRWSEKHPSRPRAPRLTLAFEDGTVEVLATCPYPPSDRPDSRWRVLFHMSTDDRIG